MMDKRLKKIKKDDRCYFIPVKSECTANCPFCVTKKQFDLTKNNLPQKLDFQTFMNQVPQYISRLNEFNYIEITGGGEPFLHPQIFDFISFFNEINLKIKLYTNGSIRNSIPTKKIFVDELTLSKMSFDDLKNDMLQCRISDSNYKSNIIDEIIYFKKFSKKLRIRLYIPYNLATQISGNFPPETAKIIFLKFLGVSTERLNILIENVDTFIFCNDINKSYKLDQTFENMLIRIFGNDKIKIDNNEKYCPDYQLIAPNGWLYSDWSILMKENTSKLKTTEELCNLHDSEIFGYHKDNIQKGIIGESSKILEEVCELIDSEKQNNKIMSLVELSDIYGALEEYLINKFPNILMDDLKIMSDTNKRAISVGER